MKYSKKIWGALLGTVAGLFIAWLLLSHSTGEAGIAKALANIFNRVMAADTGLLLGAFGLFFASQVLRAVRWMILSFQDSYPFSLSMAVTSIHVGLGHLLPLRMADVAFVGLFRYFGAVPVGHGTAKVFFAKLLDITAMGVVIGSAAAAGAGEMALAAPLLVLVGLAGIAFMFPVLKFLSRPLRWILARISPGGKVHWFEDLLRASSTRNRKGRLMLAFVVSIGVWISKLSMFCLMLAALGITGVPVWKVFLASGVTNIIMALPIHGLLSIGTVEAGWAAGFAMVGVEGAAIASINIIELGFSVHILWMTMAVLLMIMAIPVLAFHRSKGVSRNGG